MWADTSAPTASTPTVGNTYYLYNPASGLFLTYDGDIPYVRPIGQPWTIIADGDNIKLQVKDVETTCFGGKWWGWVSASNTTNYSSETLIKLENISGSNYKMRATVWGDTEAYVYINKGSEGDGSYRVACNSQDQNGLDEGYITWQFVSETDYASYIANDYTSSISNNDFTGCSNGNFPGWTITATSGNRDKHGSTAVEYWNGSASSGSFDYWQEVTGLPAGKYQLRGAMYNSTNNEAGANFDTDGQCGVYGTTDLGTAFAPVTVDATTYDAYSTDAFYVVDGNLRVGVKNNTTMTARWFAVDWVQLTYIGDIIASHAIQLPDGDMDVNQWYYFDIALEGNYNLTVTTLSDVVYTKDGTIEDGSTVTTKFSGTESIELTVGRYYVKSSSAQTFAVAPANYEYTVGTAAADISCVQGGETVTVTYSPVTNSGASFAMNGTPTITFNGEEVAISAVTNGFSFTVPTGLDAATNYTLAIPENAFGYAAGNTYNAAQNITLTTPAVFDGVYYMLNNTTNTYISRAGNYNTQAVLDNWGLAFNVSTDANNNTKLQYFDSEYWLGDDGDCYGDCTGNRVRSFNVTAVEGGYKFLNTNNSKYLAANNGITIGNAEDGASNIWSLESTVDHVANYTTNANTQAAAAATAAGLTNITTKADLETLLSSNYDKTSITITGSKAEKYQVYPGNGKDAGPVTYYSETVENLKPGLYKLSVDAFQRAASNEKVFAAGGARSLIYLYVGDAKTQLKSVSEYGSSTEYANTDYVNNGLYYPNRENTAYDALATGNYANDVYVYVAADEGKETGSLEIGIKNPTRLGGNFATWAVYNNWTLTYYEPKAIAVTYYENQTNTIQDVLLANVTMNRTIKEGYNTVVLPFTVTTNQVAEAFGAGTEVYNFSQSSEDAADGKISFNKGDGSISANTPVLIKAASASSTQNFNGVQIVAADEAKVSGTNFDFVGTYAASITIPEGDYFIGNNALYKSAGETTLKAFRASIKAKSGGAARLVIDGVETGIEALDATAVDNGKLYNLNGQIVKNAQKGIFIQNGKKVVVK